MEEKLTFEIIRVGITITLVTFVFWLFGGDGDDSDRATAESP